MTAVFGAIFKIRRRHPVAEFRRRRRWTTPFPSLTVSKNGAQAGRLPLAMAYKKSTHVLFNRCCTVKKVSHFPVPSRDVTDQTLPRREKLNYSRPGRV
jgi:hypothetical protein